MELQLIESVITSEMQEDLMRQDISLNDIVLEVHRAREVTNMEEVAPPEAAPMAAPMAAPPMAAPPMAAPTAPPFGA
jgi:hypothetical protein